MSPTEVLEVFGGLLLLVAAGGWLGYRRRRRRRRGPVDRRVVERVAEVTGAELRRILVPTLGGVVSDRMISFACKLARSDDAEIEVLYVVEVPLVLPQTAELPSQMAAAADALSEAELIGRTYGVSMRGRVEKGRFAGKVIVDVAHSVGADLIMLGGGGAKRHGGEQGRTVEYVFRNAPCDVIIERSGRSTSATTGPGGMGG